MGGCRFTKCRAVLDFGKHATAYATPESAYSAAQGGSTSRWQRRGGFHFHARASSKATCAVERNCGQGLVSFLLRRFGPLQDVWRWVRQVVLIHAETCTSLCPAPSVRAALAPPEGPPPPLALAFARELLPCWGATSC